MDPRTTGGPAKDAFEEQIASVLRSAYGVAHNLAGNREDAEDLVQEAALRAFHGFGRFETGSNFRAWFFRILVNVYREKRRRTRRRLAVLSLDESAEARSRMEPGAVADPAEDIASAVLRKLDREHVQAALDALPERYRLVSVLYFWRSSPTARSPRFVGRPLGTIRSRLHRGRRLLKKALWRVAPEAGVLPTGESGRRGPG